MYSINVIKKGWWNWHLDCLWNDVIRGHEEEGHQDAVDDEGDPRQDFSPAAGIEDTAAEQSQVEENVARNLQILKDDSWVESPFIPANPLPPPFHLAQANFWVLSVGRKHEHCVLLFANMVENYNSEE